MSAYAQTLDILNSMFEEEDELMTFQEIRKRFSKMNFDKEAKAACENVLERYQTLKRELLTIVILKRACCQNLSQLKLKIIVIL